MWIIVMLAGLLMPALVFVLARSGARLRARQAEPLPDIPRERWPRVGLVIPAAGSHPAMESAIRSLLSQSYQGGVVPVMVTADDADPASALARKLQAGFPELRHVVAGKASGCGQKNHNSLAGVRALEAEEGIEAYAFCDSTHLASPDFLRRLCAPLALGEADFATGYHEVVPEDDLPTTLGYAICVLFLRLMQALGTYTQPWGGAMAIRASTFRGKGIGAFWASNVVDDCSLTGFLKDAGVKVRLCPGALLQTRARKHGLRFWTDWLERQVLFLKFCVPDQWRQLVFGILLVSFIPLTLGSCLLSLLLLRPSGWLLLCGAACLAACAVSASSMRPFVARHVRLVPWLAGYLLSSVVFCIAALKTLGAKGLRWHGIWYEVGRQGRVISTKR